ncbi:MAG: carbohydrate kinase family protein [Candidatus Omnitrophota bacterium]
MVVIGHLLKEKILFPDGKEIGPVLGSPAAYISVCAAKLGLKVGLVTKIGKDMPNGLLKTFKEIGVDTEGIRISNYTTANLLIYEKSGKKRLEFSQKADDIYFEDIPNKYLDAEFFLVAPVDYEVTEVLIKRLKRKRLSMELGGFGGASSGKKGKTKKEKIDFLKKITRYFKIVKGGKEDCQCLFGGKGEKEAAQKFLEWGAKSAIITLGEKGALLMDKNGCFQIPPFAAKVLDCTGAGDVWHAGFMFEYLKTNDFKKAGIFASACSSFLIEKTGGVKKERFPSYGEVIQFIEGQGIK